MTVVSNRSAPFSNAALIGRAFSFIGGLGDGLAVVKAASSHHNVSLGYVDDCVAPDPLKELSSIAGKSVFAPMRPVIEVHGVCGSCSVGRAPA